MRYCTDLVYVVALWLSYILFFQAEDGIRDLVRSRGLGDVYKRQAQRAIMEKEFAGDMKIYKSLRDSGMKKEDARFVPVSYTHLTLPTSDLV